MRRGIKPGRHLCGRGVWPARFGEMVPAPRRGRGSKTGRWQPDECHPPGLPAARPGELGPSRSGWASTCRGARPEGPGLAGRRPKNRAGTVPRTGTAPSRGAGGGRGFEAKGCPSPPPPFFAAKAGGVGPSARARRDFADLPFSASHHHHCYYYYYCYYYY